MMNKGCDHIDQLTLHNVWVQVELALGIHVSRLIKLDVRDLKASKNKGRAFVYFAAVGIKCCNIVCTAVVVIFGQFLATFLWCVRTAKRLYPSFVLSSFFLTQYIHTHTHKLPLVIQGFGGGGESAQLVICGNNNRRTSSEIVHTYTHI